MKDIRDMMLESMNVGKNNFSSSEMKMVEKAMDIAKKDGLDLINPYYDSKIDAMYREGYQDSMVGNHALLAKHHNTGVVYVYDAVEKEWNELN